MERSTRHPQWGRLSLALLAAAWLTQAPAARGFYWAETKPANPTNPRQVVLWDGFVEAGRVWSIVTIPGPAGTYRVLAGEVGRGGLNIWFGRLYEVSDLRAFLASPRSFFERNWAVVSTNRYCDVEIPINYSCSLGAPLIGSGSFTYLRSAFSTFPATLPGVYRVSSASGGADSLLYLEFIGGTSPLRAVATQFLANRTWRAWTGPLEETSPELSSLVLRPALRAKQLSLIWRPRKALKLNGAILEVEPTCTLTLTHPGAFSCVDRHGVPNGHGSTLRIR